MSLFPGMSDRYTALDLANENDQLIVLAREGLSAVNDKWEKRFEVGYKTSY